MPAPIPILEDFDVSPIHGFLPSSPPLERLPDYFQPWEHVMQNLQGLLLSKRLRGHINSMAVLSTDNLDSEPEWRRAYQVLAFMAHGYIWAEGKPAQRVPTSISIPFIAVCKHLDLPLVMTYAGTVLWNWKPLYDNERSDTLANLNVLSTFTGSMDEKWFYLISVAIEARAGPLIPLLLNAVDDARHGRTTKVTEALKFLAERLDEFGTTLTKMYENCDPYVFYNRIRIYFAGSKNMADAGLPNGVIFDDGRPMHKQKYVQFSGASNAQSSIFQFFDIMLGVEHRPAGEVKTPTKKSAPTANFIHDMRKYMPGAHARFLEAASKIANIRDFVQSHPEHNGLTLAFDAALAMLSALRDKHIQMVSRYIVIQSKNAPENEKKTNLAIRTKSDAKPLRGTGGSSLIAFLRQARDETGQPAIEDWARKLISKEKSVAGIKLDTIEKVAKQTPQCKGLSTSWTTDEESGGICYA